jgi:galactokinase
VSENARTVEAADAWEKGDWEVVGRLMNESHSSMKDDYETSCEEIDILQELAKNFDGVYGSRLTGGGFGGCTVTLVKKNKARELMYHLRREYKEKYDIIPSIFETTPGDGASAIIL